LHCACNFCARAHRPSGAPLPATSATRPRKGIQLDALNRRLPQHWAMLRAEHSVLTGEVYDGDQLRRIICWADKNFSETADTLPLGTLFAFGRVTSACPVSWLPFLSQGVVNRLWSSVRAAPHTSRRDYFPLPSWEAFRAARFPPRRLTRGHH